MKETYVFSRSDSPPLIHSRTISSSSIDSAKGEHTSRPVTPLLSASNLNSISVDKQSPSTHARSRRSTIEPEPIRTSSILYHIKRTHSHRSLHLRPGIHELDLCESFTDYFSAVRSAYTLELLSSYRSSNGQSHVSEVEIYRQCDFAAEDWYWGLGCLVRAEAVNGDLWTVEMEIEYEKMGTLGDEVGKLYWPLFFVVVVEMFRGDAISALLSSTSEKEKCWRFHSRIHSSWATADSARIAAKGALIAKEEGGRESFIKYEEKKDAKVQGDLVADDGWISDWGANVASRAVDGNGTNYFVALLESRSVSGESVDRNGDDGADGLFG